MDENRFISLYLAPLAKNVKGAEELKNDAASIPQPRNGYDLVVTKDAITEGVHFLSGTSPANLARKLVRVNISDLASMGADPSYYLIAALLPKDTDEQWAQEFSAGLAEQQSIFNISLIGGDTIFYDGPLTLTMTIFGEMWHNAALTRTGGKPGDFVYVSGTIGDSTLGLKISKGEFEASSAEDKIFFLSRYNMPQPRTALGKQLFGIAHSVTDISDGLVLDLERICDQSGVGAKVSKRRIPLSKKARAALKDHPEWFEDIITGGDDYELLFTAPKVKDTQVVALGAKLGIQITKIGQLKRGSGVSVIDEDGNPVELKTKGYIHSTNASNNTDAPSKKKA